MQTYQNYQIFQDGGSLLSDDNRVDIGPILHNLTDTIIYITRHISPNLTQGYYVEYWNDSDVDVKEVLELNWTELDYFIGEYLAIQERLKMARRWLEEMREAHSQG